MAIHQTTEEDVERLYERVSELERRLWIVEQTLKRTEATSRRFEDITEGLQ